MSKRQASRSSLQCDADSGRSSYRTQSPYVTNETDVDSLELSCDSGDSLRYEPSIRGCSGSIREFSGRPTACDAPNTSTSSRIGAVELLLPFPTAHLIIDSLLAGCEEPPCEGAPHALGRSGCPTILAQIEPLHQETEAQSMVDVKIVNGNTRCYNVMMWWP